MSLPEKSKKFSAIKALFSLIPLLTLFLTTSLQSKSNWYEQESEHFIVIYRPPHAYLVEHILQSAENALVPLMRVFNYKPSEKIIINTYDFSDYGAAGATTVPHNFIRIEIEPLELGYENIPFNERIQWLIAHELVHVVVNDLASNTESFARSLFSKVPPEKKQPLSIYFSLLTNFRRYTPRWHQEGIAVFMETWLNGGFGRILGNFDEMYFRSMVLDNKPFPKFSELDLKTKDNSFLLNILDYLYGARFAAFLAATFGTKWLIAWYSTHAGEFYKGFEKKFKTTFGLELSTAWKYFVLSERQFQKKNIRILKSSPLTPIMRIQKQPMGWVTQPYTVDSGFRIIFGNHQPHFLTSIKLFDLKKRIFRQIGSLPTPSIIQIASTAYDKNLKLFFYTTNNNKLYRDIWVLNLNSGNKKLLFKDCRVGHITVSPATHELWGVRHSAGKAALVYSDFPYRTLKTVVEFKIGDVLQHLSISPSGRFLAATLHQSSGRQAIIVANVELLKKGEKFTYQVISEEGSPEFPSWSPDEEFLYWNAFTNGVSNIYRYHGKSSKIQAMSHTLRGLFRPVYFTAKYLFAFEFSSEGFIPVIIPNKPAVHLPAIQYYGQKIVKRTPRLTELTLHSSDETPHQITNSVSKKPYKGIYHLQFHSLIPVISGFLDQKVIGLFTHIADPLFLHDLTFDVGFSPFKHNHAEPIFHFRAYYEYRRKFKLEIEHNAPNFYDLFNERKVGMIGTKVTFGHTYYWKYDMPHKIKQTSELVFYTGIEAINDNLVKVSNPDFLVFESKINSQNVRRAIGSVDSEFGNMWSLTLMALGVRPKNLQVVGGLYAELDRFMTWAWPHNVLHLKLAAGYLHTKENLAIGKFYFGGFGNQYLENKEVKQYRNVFRFPGIPIYSLVSGRFAKVMIENNLPPLRLGNVKMGKHFLSYIDVSWFTQGIILNSNKEKKWFNFGGQINFMFKHWFNLESTLSAGIAHAWNRQQSSWEWFISFKLLKN